VSAKTLAPIIQLRAVDAFAAQKRRELPTRSARVGFLEDAQLLLGCDLPTAASVVFGIDGFYNPVRRHSVLGYVSPMSYEQHEALARAV